MHGCINESLADGSLTGSQIKGVNGAHAKP